MRRSMSGAIALVALGPLTLLHATDLLKVTRGGSREKGAIVDGALNGTAVNDSPFTDIQGGSFLKALFPQIPLGDFSTSRGANEVIGFAGRRPPTLVPVSWTPGNDTVSLLFEDEYLIPVQVWIVQGPFDVTRDVALDAGVETSQAWSGERQGVAFESFDIADATNDPDLLDPPNLLDFNCNLASDIQTRIGFVPDRLNIYYVSTVDFGQGGLTTNGVWCGNGVIALGHTTSGLLLAHEIGHAFDLQHINQPPASDFFDSKNVMHPASFNRHYFTEGQTFRAVFSSFSALNGAPNGIYDVRPGAPMRDCGGTETSTTDDLCPPVQKRIWADGALPPN